MAWWNDYDRGDYGRWSTRYDSSYWNNPEGRSFGYGGAGYRGGYGYDYADRGRYGEDYTPRVAPSESPAYGRQADRVLRRNAYDAGYRLQPRGGRGMDGGYRGGYGYGRSGYRGGNAGGFGGYGSDYRGYGVRSSGATAATATTAVTTGATAGRGTRGAGPRPAPSETNPKKETG